MNSTTEDRIINLWPTMFLHFAPDGHQTHQDGLAARVKDAPGEDILTATDDAAKWLNAQISDSATAYLERFATAPASGFTVHGQAVIHHHGDYQPLRNHPDAYLSGIYYVTAPKDLREKRHRSDVDSNAISFYDPRFAMNMGAIAKDPNAEMEKLVHPKPGILVMWPSFVDFFIHPNLSSEAQLSVHFKIILDERA